MVVSLFYKLVEIPQDLWQLQPMESCLAAQSRTLSVRIGWKPEIDVRGSKQIGPWTVGPNSWPGPNLPRTMQGMLWCWCQRIMMQIFNDWPFPEHQSKGEHLARHRRWCTKRQTCAKFHNSSLDLLIVLKFDFPLYFRNVWNKTHWIGSIPDHTDGPKYIEDPLPAESAAKVTWKCTVLQILLKIRYFPNICMTYAVCTWQGHWDDRPKSSAGVCERCKPNGTKRPVYVCTYIYERGLSLFSLLTHFLGTLIVDCCMPCLSCPELILL